MGKGACLIPSVTGVLPCDTWVLSRQPGGDLGAVAGVLSKADIARASATITARPDYAPTPLLPMPGVARLLGIAHLACKDESQRFGKGGVKALGAPYGLTRLLEDASGTPEAVAATDGNHGLALAWAAQGAGVPCRIFISEDVDPPRQTRLTQAGAQLSIIKGTYDDAVAAAEAYAAAAPDRLLVTDTDYTGGLPVTRHIMAGYAVLGQELAAQTAAAPPSHILLQCGVGGMAAGVIAGYVAARGRLDTKLVLVEPQSAACLYQSLKGGAMQGVGGDLLTHMMGLSCGHPSRPAWDILSELAAGAVAVGEAVAVHLQPMLREGRGGDAPFACGDTGVAGFAALAELAATGQMGALGLGPDARVVVVNSEGPVVV
ncbi:diaminopropionate ammonia-lyase [Rubricella aquisinus]|uniref:Diaminopropionate ammonia-lyase n=1 Tax=Rubricella aquisinus TaxID=2028108 RepID=A0A840WQI8_9RHOB|nr:pyridoxal-phosphate dependent enzyme [Rubricella aquisinus]MBB5516313.1 diaminopropionate ammonia-lyase [Rubricella aquisinus]